MDRDNSIIMSDMVLEDDLTCTYNQKQKVSWGKWIARSIALVAALTIAGPKFSGVFDIISKQPHHGDRNLRRHRHHSGPPPPPAALAGFVHRKGDQLILDDKPFRFVSFNAPDLHVSEDGTWHRVTRWEQEDGLQTIARMGGQVVRIYPFSIVGGMTNGTYAHIMGKDGQYNEELFQDLDRLLDIAQQMDIRVIIPFIDNWEWWGGINQFTALYDKDFLSFYRDEEVRQAFKDFIKYLLTRKNTITGELYKDDPNILAWETGNELNYDEVDSNLPTSKDLDAWTVEIARYVKSIDPNHMVIDGRILMNRDVSEVSLKEPAVDIISDHFYPNTPYSFDERLQKMLSFTKGKKPFMIGEFGLVIPITVEALLKQVAKEPAVAGGMLWSLRSHSNSGGFYWHHEYDNYWSYHYPGWETNNGGSEKEVMQIMETYSYAIQKKPVPALAAPGRPELIDSSNTEAIAWRGAVGAQYYELERQDEDVAVDAWTKLSDKLDDSVNPFVPYKDATALPNKSYRYRIYAVNSAGRGEPSDPLLIASPPPKPVSHHHQVPEKPKVHEESAVTSQAEAAAAQVGSILSSPPDAGAVAVAQKAGGDGRRRMMLFDSGGKGPDEYITQ